MNDTHSVTTGGRWTELISSLLQVLDTDPAFEAEIRRKISARRCYLECGPYEDRYLKLMSGTAARA
jgi:hypothetical protein